MAKTKQTEQKSQEEIEYIKNYEQGMDEIDAICAYHQLNKSIKYKDFPSEPTQINIVFKEDFDTKEVVRKLINACTSNKFLYIYTLRKSEDVNDDNKDKDIGFKGSANKNVDLSIVNKFYISIPVFVPKKPKEKVDVDGANCCVHFSKRDGINTIDWSLYNKWSKKLSNPNTHKMINEHCNLLPLTFTPFQGFLRKIPLIKHYCYKQDKMYLQRRKELLEDSIKEVKYLTGLISEKEYDNFRYNYYE